MNYLRALVFAGTPLLLLCAPLFSAEQKPPSKNRQPLTEQRHALVDKDIIMGDYQGVMRGRDGIDSAIFGQMVAKGGGVYQAILLSAFDHRIAPLAVTTGRVQSNGVSFDSGAMLEGGGLRGRLKGSEEFELKRVERLSPSLGTKAPKDAIILFDGVNTERWVGLNKSTAAVLPLGWKTTADGALEVVPGSGWAMTEQRFQSLRLHLEFRIPLLPSARGQARGNSGVHLQGRYEVQILDSYGLAGRDNECGAVYKVASPRVNMCAPPLQWQTFDIVFYAAHYNRQGKKTLGPRISVMHNGVAIHENLEIPEKTAFAPVSESAEPGPIVLQDHGTPVQFRNIWLVELNDDRGISGVVP